MRYTQSGTAVASVTLATNRKWKSESGELKEEVTFIDCTAFGKTAEIIGQYCRKGNPLLVEGRLRTESWDDKTTGAKRSKLVVIVENIQLMGGKNSSAESSQAAPAPAHNATTNAAQRPTGNAAASAPANDQGGAGDDDVPF